MKKNLATRPDASEADFEVGLDRDEELSTRKKIEETLLETYKDVEKGFQAQLDRSDEIADYWDVYNCKLNQHQFYSGNSRIFVPITHDAVNARKTRFVNQLFPQTGRYVEVTTEDGTMPQAQMALLEHYVRLAKLRTQVAPALVKNGDVEGQYTVYVDWQETTRHVVSKTKKKAKVGIGAEHQAEASDAPGEPDAVADEQGLEVETDEDVYDIHEETLKSGRPCVEVIADTDFLVLPMTVDSLEVALEAGGSVTILRRWTVAQLEKMKKRGSVRADQADKMIEELRKEDRPGEYDKPKKMVDAAGVHHGERGKYALVYETWLKLYLAGERRLCRAFFGGDRLVLGCKRNPYWSDRLPIKSAPVEKVQGSFKGISKVYPIADIQYAANDAVNQGADACAYALSPIILTDPEKNPRAGSMILSMGAVWLTDPKSTQFAKFPALWKDALEIVMAHASQIFQTLGVNPARITQTNASPKKKPSQAEIANEQQIDILTTADAVSVLEDEIFTPVLTFMIELDHQFRKDDLIVREYGEMGMRANMQAIPPTQMDKRYQFRWYGVEAARNAQQIQQQISGLNILRGMPPQLYEGYRLDLAPAIAQLVENTFGPRLAPLIFKDARMEITMDPNEENRLLIEGLALPVHLMDNHQEHLMVHMQTLQLGDPSGVIRVHMMAHAKALEQQQQQAMAQLGPPQQQGVPGGGGQGSRGPRIGAQPGQPRGGQNPPGAIHEDRMKDPRMMPSQ